MKARGRRSLLPSSFFLLRKGGRGKGNAAGSPPAARALHLPLQPFGRAGRAAYVSATRVRVIGVAKANAAERRVVFFRRRGRSQGAASHFFVFPFPKTRGNCSFSLSLSSPLFFFGKKKQIFFPKNRTLSLPLFFLFLSPPSFFVSEDGHNPFQLFCLVGCHPSQDASDVLFPLGRHHVPVQAPRMSSFFGRRRRRVTVSLPAH